MSVYHDHLLKLLLVGDSGVGKTSILLSFTSDDFKPGSKPTIGVDLKVKTVQVEGKTLKLTIWDTAGQERFRTLTSAYYRGAHGVILVYDVSNRVTFTNVKQWLREVDLFSTKPEVVKMLVANKTDLKDRQVSKEDGLDFARENSMLFIETSAKTKTGVRDAFEELVMKILDIPALLDDEMGQIRVKETNSDDDEPQDPCAC